MKIQERKILLDGQKKQEMQDRNIPRRSTVCAFSSWTVINSEKLKI